MTTEEHRIYAREYRRQGYGANADARYREKNRAKLTAYMREYRKKHKRQTP